MLDIVVGFISEMGLDAIKDKLSEKHNEKKIKNDIKEFAEKQFNAKYKSLLLRSEIDYGGLQEYLSNKLPDEIKIFLFDNNQEKRGRCRESILNFAYTYTSSINNEQKAIIKDFIDIALSISTEYYIDKVDGNYRLLHNITVDNILTPILEAIKHIPEDVASKVVGQFEENGIVTTKGNQEIPLYITNQPQKMGSEFICRDYAINKLCRAINQNKKIVLINSLGGIGKTTVARSLYHKLKHEFNHIAWVDYHSNTRESLLSSFTIYDNVEDLNERYRKVINFLRNANRDTLIFIDNVSYEDYYDSGIEWLETLEANIVLTSRRNSIGNFECFPIDILTKEQCVDIFYKYYRYDMDHTHQKLVYELVELVKCHTLSVELLARVSNSLKVPLSEYLNKLKEIDFVYPELKVEKNQTQNMKIIAMNLSKLFELASVSNEEAKILKNFSIMPSVKMPKILSNWLDFDMKSINRLKKLGLLSSEDKEFYMHPIVKEAIQIQYKIQYKDCVQIIGYLEQNNYLKDKDIGLHISIADAILFVLNNLENDEICRLYDCAANMYYSQSIYQKALEYHYKALTIRKKLYGEEHIDIANSYEYISLTYLALGQYSKAVGCSNKVLAIRNKIYGEGDPSTVRPYESMILAYDILGEYELMLEYSYKILVIFEKAYGKKHPDTAKIYENIGGIYAKLGKHEQSLDYSKKALAINKDIYGDENLNTAKSYGNIGIVYATLGEREKAEEYTNKTQMIIESIFDEENSDLLALYETIAEIYNILGEHEQSLQHYNNLLAISEKICGGECDDSAKLYESIGENYDKLGQHEQALKYYKISLMMKVKIYGEEHLYVGMLYNKISETYDSLAKSTETLEYYYKALEYAEKVLYIYEKTYGKKHCYTATSYDNIGMIYYMLGEYEYALDYSCKALLVREKSDNYEARISYNNISLIYGKLDEHALSLEFLNKELEIKRRYHSEEHYDIGISYHKIGMTYTELGEYEQALKYYNEALMIYEKVNDDKQPNMAELYGDLAELYSVLGNLEQSLGCYNEALTIYKEIYGDEDPHIVLMYTTIGSVYDDLEEYIQALECYKIALKVAKKLYGEEHPVKAVLYGKIGSDFIGLGDDSKALEYFNKMLTVYKKIYGEEHHETVVAKELIKTVRGWVSDKLDIT